MRGVPGPRYHRQRMADFAFTLPGWVVVLATGIMLSIARGWKELWLHLSLLLFLGWLGVWHALVLRARGGLRARDRRG